MKTYVVTFGSDDYQSSAEVLRHTALTCGRVDGVFVWNESSIASFAKEVPHMFKHRRGFGLWCWKPYIILKTMATYLQEGDVLVYCDACTSFVRDVAEYAQAARGHDIVLFRLGQAVQKNYLNKFWTKRDCFEQMGCKKDKYFLEYQLNAAVQIYRKGATATAFLEKYLQCCIDETCMDDTYRTPNFSGFVDHRHDQSVLTNLYVIHRDVVLLMRDCTQFGRDDKDPAGLQLEPLIDHHRRVYGELQTVTVVTPTIGTPHLERAIRSVQDQTLPGVTHLVVVDGPQYAQAVEKVVHKFRHRKPIHVLQLPQNTGAGGWNGHRVYGAAPFLCNSRYVAYLDEDNAYQPDHLLDLMAVVHEKDLDWAFSLRRIVSPEGLFVTNDCCESLGSFAHSVLSASDFMVDTSCMVVRREVAVACAPHWYLQQREADRAFSGHLLRHYKKHRGVPKHSVDYTVSSSDVSVAGEFFLRGNSLRRYDFAARPTLYVFHFGPQQTARFFDTQFCTDRSYAFDEWQMTLLRDLAKDYNLIDGYACEEMIPPESTVLVNVCLPQQLPVPTLRRRDLFKVAYTLESPNIRHQAQWDWHFLHAHFDHVLTYWKPLLAADPTWATFCPHNTHHLDFANPKDVEQLHDPLAKCDDKSVCMVLERRNLSGAYAINGTALQCLDGLRERFVKDLRAVTVYGRGWDSYKGSANVTVGHTRGKEADRKPSVELIKHFTFNIIVENCDADGYVSEKLYDCLIAGAIPLYYGNNNDDVGIPRDVYVDLRQFESPADLQGFLDSLSLDDIRRMKQTIAAKRMDVLQKVSTAAFAAAAKRAFGNLARSMASKPDRGLISLPPLASG